MQTSSEQGFEALCQQLMKTVLIPKSATFTQQQSNNTVSDLSAIEAKLVTGVLSFDFRVAGNCFDSDLNIHKRSCLGSVGCVF